jgi:hypothetical protein
LIFAALPLPARSLEERPDASGLSYAVLRDRRLLSFISRMNRSANVDEAFESRRTAPDSG